MLPVDYTKNEYHETRHAELIGNESLQLAWAACAREFYFEGLPSGMEIFEFGGALGYNLLALTEQHSCHMLELSEIGRSHANKFGIVTYADVKEIGEKKFDVVLCRHVLEHVDNPLEILELLKGMLKPGGKLVLVLPIEESCALPVMEEIDFHLFTWNPRTICNLLRKARFFDIDYRFQFFNGRRRCLPLHKVLGAKSYVTAVQLVGRLTRSKELVVICH
jgi:SAM-dependent methyltransferase